MNSRNIERARKPSVTNAAHNKQVAQLQTCVQIYFSRPKAGAAFGHHVRKLIGCNQRLS